MKQARALMAVKIFPEVADAAAPGRKSLAHQGISQPSLAARVGVSLSIMEEVCRFWRKIKLDKTPAQQEDLINQVLAGISCDDALNGEKGRLATAGKPRPPTRTWSLMTRNANSLKDRWKDFVKLDDEDRKLDIIEKLSEALAAAPEDVKPALRAALEGGES